MAGRLLRSLTPLGEEYLGNDLFTTKMSVYFARGFFSVEISSTAIALLLRSNFVVRILLIPFLYQQSPVRRNDLLDPFVQLAAGLLGVHGPFCPQVKSPSAFAADHGDVRRFAHLLVINLDTPTCKTSWNGQRVRHRSPRAPRLLPFPSSTS